MSIEEAIATRGMPSGPSVSIVGVGGAGNNLLVRAIGGGISPNCCIAVNTDRTQLSRSPALNKVLLQGNSLENLDSQQLETKKMLQLSSYRVRPFTEGADITIILAGLGGITATGTAPLIAQWTRTPIRHVLSVVAIPFIHEREKRFVALRGLKHMVEACECTVVVDNAMDDGRVLNNGRQADEKAFTAIQCLSDLLSTSTPELVPEILRIMSLGQIAVACSAEIRPKGSIQSAVVEALGKPSAGLPISKTKGAILLHSGPTMMSNGQAARAYETLESLIGKKIAFLQANIIAPSEPTISILLTGYDYGTAVNAFVDFIEDLYDVEYGQESSGFFGIQMPLFQMELGEL